MKNFSAIQDSYVKNATTFRNKKVLFLVGACKQSQTWPINGFILFHFIKETLESGKNVNTLLKFILQSSFYMNAKSQIYIHVVEFSKVVLTIAKEKSNHWGVFLLSFKLLHRYSIERMYQKHETGDQRSIHEKFITSKEKTSPIIRRRWGYDALRNAVLSWFFF